MTPAEFQTSLANPSPPAGLSTALAALWWMGKGEWNRAHQVAMSGEDADCAWAHAHLHRVEGDLDNARYWYHRAGRAPATGELVPEWTAMVAALLGSPRR